MKKICQKFYLFIYIALFFAFLILCLSSCAFLGLSNQTIKDGIFYKKVNYVKNGVSTECYFVTGCKDNVEILNIESSINGLLVLGIEESAFVNNKNLKEVTIPDTITSISLNSAPFSGCTSIEKITLATDDVENLFKEYGSGDENNTDPLPESLKYIYLTNACKKITQRSFRYCRYLQELHIPSSVTEIDDGTSGTTIGVNGNVSTGRKFENLPFLACEKLTIYCESSSKPSGWGDYWNYIDSDSQAQIIWGDYYGDKNSSDSVTEKECLALLDENHLFDNYAAGATIHITHNGAATFLLKSNSISTGFMWDLEDYQFSTRNKYTVVFKNLSFSGFDPSTLPGVKLDWHDSSYTFLRYYNTETKYFGLLDNDHRYVFFNSISYETFSIDFRFSHKISNAEGENLYFSFWGIEEGGSLSFDNVSIYY